MGAELKWTPQTPNTSPPFSRQAVPRKLMFNGNYLGFCVDFTREIFGGGYLEHFQVFGHSFGVEQNKRKAEASSCRFKMPQCPALWTHGHPEPGTVGNSAEVFSRTQSGAM